MKWKTFIFQQVEAGQYFFNSFVSCLILSFRIISFISFCSKSFSPSFTFFSNSVRYVGSEFGVDFGLFGVCSDRLFIGVVEEGGVISDEMVGEMVGEVVIIGEVGVCVVEDGVIYDESDIEYCR